MSNEYFLDQIKNDFHNYQMKQLSETTNVYYKDSEYFLNQIRDTTNVYHAYRDDEYYRYEIKNSVLYCDIFKDDGLSKYYNYEVESPVEKSHKCIDIKNIIFSFTSVLVGVGAGLALLIIMAIIMCWRKSI